MAVSGEGHNASSATVYERRCAYCGVVLPVGSHKRKRFCSVDHKNAFHKRVKSIGYSVVSSGDMGSAKRSHGGNPDKSRRLGLIVAAMRGKGWVSTRQLQLVTNDMAVSTTIADLRKAGHKIASRYSHTTYDGRRVYEYLYGGK